MEVPHDTELHPHPVFEKQKVSFWRKLGGGSLGISIIVHAIILAIGVYLVVQVIPPPPEPKIDFLQSGGGGEPAANPSQKVRVQMPQNNASRIAAKGASSSFTLPEPEAASDMNALSSLDTGSLSGGMSGKGSGGGSGSGQGLGVGDSMGIGIGSGGIGTVFGVSSKDKNALVGTFYDLKQDKNRKPTPLGEITNAAQIANGTRDVLANFVKQGWNERSFANYYQASQKLYLTKITMPSINADEAPKAFNCEKEVKGSRWVVIYRGLVRPPKTGKYRFVGAGDDVLTVRFNRKNVFDFGYELATGNFSFRPKRAQAVSSGDKEWKKFRRDLSMPDPVQLRPYPIPGRITQDLGGLAVGEEFEANANTDYPIEIMVSEIPGGFFCAYLLIEEVGVEYPKTPQGLPLIPIFRTSGDLPDPKNLPPFNPASPIWQVKGDSTSDI